MRAIILVITVFLMAVVSGCQETNPVVPDAYTINGTIAFVDSNFSDQGTGEYRVVAWGKSAWYPQIGGPAREQVLDIIKEDNKYVLGYRYRLAEMPSGSYVVSLQYVEGATRKTLGIYGCNLPLDSNCYKAPSKIATIVTTEGLVNIDVTSFADTSAVVNP